MLTGSAYQQPFDPFFECIVTVRIFISYDHYKVINNELSHQILITQDIGKLFRVIGIIASPAVMDLLQKLLTLSPRERMTLEEAFEHPWVRFTMT